MSKTRPAHDTATRAAPACDDSWAGLLDDRERATVARKLANACKRFHSAQPTPGQRRGGYDPMAGRMARRMTSVEMSDLHRDLTGEPAEVPDA